MNRILLVPLVIALAAGGCNSSRCDTSDVTFFWRFVGAPVTGQQRVAGDFSAANNGCAAAGIDADGIDLTIAGVRQTFPCAGAVDQLPGITLAGATRGVYDWTIDAYRGNVLAFTQSGTVDARACGAAVVRADLQAVTPQPLVVYYDVNGNPPTACKVQGVPVANVVFELRNAQNQIVDSSCVGGRDPVTSACVQEGTLACDPVSLGFVVPDLQLGTYTMQYLELYGTSAAAPPLAAICTAPVVHDGLPAFVNTVAPVGGACPTSPATPLAASASAAP